MIILEKWLFYIFIQKILHRDAQSEHVDFLKDILSLQRKEQLSFGSVRIQWLLIKNCRKIRIGIYASCRPKAHRNWNIRCMAGKDKLRQGFYGGCKNNISNRWARNYNNENNIISSKKDEYKPWYFRTYGITHVYW